MDEAVGRPLQYLRVLDLLTGPMAAIGRQLAELGADVIRLESPEGSAERQRGPLAAGISLDFAAANLGKRATTLDRLDALAVQADILIQSGNVDVTSLRSANPRLVILSVSDFGRIGRFARWTGSGPVFHALSGALSRSGLPGRVPLLPPGDLAHACAAVQAVFAVLLAYWNRLKTGRGDHLDFSIMDGAAQTIDPGYGINGSASGGIPVSQLPRDRIEARHHYPILLCKDGHVRLCVLSPRQWRQMFAWMGRPQEFADPSFENLNIRFGSQELLAAYQRFAESKTRAEMEEEGERFGVPVSSLFDVGEAIATSHMIGRRAVETVELAPAVRASFPNGVIEVDGVRMGIAGPVPQLEKDLTWWDQRLEVTASDSGERPLSHIRALDFGVIVVGAESGRLLADQGADVIKVESSGFPDGARQNLYGGLISPGFAVGHRNKRSLGLNLAKADGKKLLLDLIARTDVLLSNFKGGTLESLGLDYQTLKAVNPRIVVSDSSAFGPTGPWSRRMGYGPLVRASAGLTMQWRYPDDPDSFSDALTVYPDHVAGRVAAIGVLALLIRRLRTGAGGAVSTSQAEVMLNHMAVPIALRSLEQAGQCVSRGDREANSTAYACRGNDEWCVVTERDEADRQAIARVTEGAPLADWLKTRPAREAMETLQAAGIPAGAMLRVPDMPGFDYYKERGFLRPGSHPHLKDPFLIERAPVRSEQMPDPPEKPAPLMGEHTIEIAREALCLSDGEIDRLIAGGVLEQFKMPERDVA